MKRAVEMRVNAKGFGTFVVDGVDISNSVTAVHVDFEAGRPTRVEIELRPDSVVVMAEEPDMTYRRNGS